jgi:TolB-like protein
MGDEEVRERLKRGRVVPVLVVYAGACWVVLQVVATLKDLIGLPGWVGPVSVVLLLAGLVVVGATAWVQSSALTSAREAAGEVPGDWQIGFKDLIRSLRKRRMPHLNWGRVITGGLVAVSLLIGVAGAYVLLQRDSGVLVAAGSDAGVSVAVVPFRSGDAGADGPLAEALMDLLATNIDGITGLRAISPRSLAAGIGVGPIDDVRLFALSRRLGATYVVTGNVIRVAERLRVTADVRDVHGARVGVPLLVDGGADELLELADQLSVQLAGALLQRQPEFAPGLRPSASLTASPAALRAFLDGEALFRRLDFRKSLEAYELAVDHDSTFALAWARVAMLNTWTSPGAPEIADALERAQRHADRLPDRDRLIIDGLQAVHAADLDAVPAMRAATRRYPDDPGLWYVLGEFYAHHGQYLELTPRATYDAFMTAIRLEPRFQPNYVHAIELSIMLDDTAGSRALIAAATDELGNEDPRALRIAHDLAFATGDRWYSARAAVDTLSYHGTSVEVALSLPRLLHIKEQYVRRRRESQPDGRTARILATTLAVRGRFAEATAQLEDPLLPPYYRTQLAHFMYSSGAPAPAGGWDRYLAIENVDTTLTGPLLHAAAYAADLGRWTAHENAIARMVKLEQARAAEGNARAVEVIRGRRIAAEAYALYRRGDLPAAQALFDSILPIGGDGISGMVRWWAGEVALAQGRTEDALRFYESLRAWDSDLNEFPARHLRLATLHELGDRPAAARAALQELLLIWKDADASHLLARDARRRLTSLD